MRIQRKNSLRSLSRSWYCIDRGEWKLYGSTLNRYDFCSLYKELSHMNLWSFQELSFQFFSLSASKKTYCLALWVMFSCVIVRVCDSVYCYLNHVQTISNWRWSGKWGDARLILWDWRCHLQQTRWNFT